MSKSQRGSSNPAWRGGHYVNSKGYVMIYSPDHPRTHGGCYVAEHTLVAEQVLGRYLPSGAIVHHQNDDRGNNRPDNLVICESVSYHRLIHIRRDGFRATGNPGARKCAYCHHWTFPGDFDVIPMGSATIHRACRSFYMKSRYDPVVRHAKYIEREKPVVPSPTFGGQPISWATARRLSKDGP